MPKTIQVDMNDASTTVSLTKEPGGTIIITGEYMMSGGGYSGPQSRSFTPQAFTAAERTTLQNAYNIVVAKCRAAEEV